MFSNNQLSQILSYFCVVMDASEVIEPNKHKVIKDTCILAVDYTSSPKSKQSIGVGG